MPMLPEISADRNSDLKRRLFLLPPLLAFFGLARHVFAIAARRLAFSCALPDYDRRRANSEVVRAIKPGLSPQFSSEMKAKER